MYIHTHTHENHTSLRHEVQTICREPTNCLSAERRRRKHEKDQETLQCFIKFTQRAPRLTKVTNPLRFPHKATIADEDPYQLLFSLKRAARRTCTQLFRGTSNIVNITVPFISQINNVCQIICKCLLFTCFNNGVFNAESIGLVRSCMAVIQCVSPPSLWSEIYNINQHSRVSLFFLHSWFSSSLHWYS